jgi:homoserine kinase
VSEVVHHHVQVPGTTANLGPGFDAFGLAVDRYLTVRSLPRDAQTERVRTTGEGADELAADGDNLVWRSFVRACEHLGRPAPDVALRAHNDLPLERGLGSSSAAIVAGIVLARALTGAVVGDPLLVELADELEGHPDNVAPAVLGGLVACARTDDGRLVVRRRDPAPHLRPVLFVPAARQATTAARAVLPRALPCDAVAAQAARAGHVLAGLVGSWPVEPALAGDLLHEPARLEVMAGSGALVAGLRERGVHAWLSGAGPAVAAMVPVHGAASGDLGDLAAAHGFVARAHRVDLSGAFACPDDGCAVSGVGGCVQCPRQRVC